MDLLEIRLRHDPRGRYLSDGSRGVKKVFAGYIDE